MLTSMGLFYYREKSCGITFLSRSYLTGIFDTIKYDLGDEVINRINPWSRKYFYEEIFDEEIRDSYNLLSSRKNPQA